MTPLSIKLPRKFDKWSAIKFEGENFSIKPARYAKNKYAVQTKGENGLKSRQCRLASAIGGNCYSNRCKSYIMSAAKAERFYALAVAGWDACVMTDRLEPPRKVEANEGA